MEISVAEYAKLAGISEGRVRQLARSGSIPGRKAGGIWLLDQAGLARRTEPIRPMSLPNAWRLASYLANPSHQDTTPVQRQRLRERKSRITAAGEPERLLAAWLARRGSAASYTIDVHDLADFRKDPRLRLSGVSHPANRLLSNNELEAYVAAGGVGELVGEWLLVPQPSPTTANVVLHLVENLPDVIPLAYVVADLVDRCGWREQQEARRILQDMVAHV